MPGATSFSSSPRMRGSYPGTATPVFLLQAPGVTGEPGRLADRRWAMRAARFDVRPAATPDGIVMITVMVHREDIGRLACQVCGTCRKALICKESTGQEYQGPGLGRRALLAALATAPDHARATTPQYDVSVRFWQRMSRAAGASLTGDPAHGGPCPHMH
jgi:hypothetical protein